jgi:hypothetical protein
MTEKKKYIKPQTEVVDAHVSLSILDGSRWNWGQAKETNFDEEEEEDMEEDNFPGWGD